MPLLERDALLAQLAAEWSRVNASAGTGRLVFVEGEAGIGKTSLVRAFARSLDARVPVYRGACEALQTPRPLGALHDIAAQTGGPLRALLDAGGDRHRVFVAFVDLLRAQPALVLLEDLHWADGATLDLLRHAGRRLDSTRSLLIGSYRTDELTSAHPLRAVLGDLATTGALHLAPAPLSPAAVQSLCEGLDVDAQQVHRRTGGNPFFVTEVLAAPAADVPGSVQDAVLARAGRLSASARAVLDAAAIAGPRVEPWVLEALAAAESAAIDEGLATGVLCSDAGAITFRHELARQAVLRAMSPTRATSLHRMAFDVLLAKAVPHALSRLALHAEGAGDAAAVRHWAPLAAREAMARGAHTQAVQHWARTLAHAEGDAARAPLLDVYADELRACGLVEAAVTAKQQAAQAWRTLGRTREAIRSLTDLAKLHLMTSRHDPAEQAIKAARALLPPAQADAQERWWIDASEANVRRHTLDYAAAAALARPVAAWAERHAEPAMLADACNTLGAALFACGSADEAVATLERGFAAAESAGADLLAAMALSNLAGGCLSLLRLSDAEHGLDRGAAWCAERDLDAPRLMQRTLRAAVHLHRGRWDLAGADALEVIGSPRAMPIVRLRAYALLGRLRARRGDPDARLALVQAQRLGGETIATAVTVHLALAECAWLEGQDDEAAREAAAGLAAMAGKQLPWVSAELRLWQRLAGAAAPVGNDERSDHPWALEAAGQWQQAAQRWRALGCPYDTARASMQGDEGAQREALRIAESLGAKPLAQRIRGRLLAAGARGLPRGPRTATQQHPAGLTTKEVAVLALLAAGLRNKEIAARLSRSARTVDHHVESIFAKLGVDTRAEAVGAAFRLGLVAAQAASRSD